MGSAVHGDGKPLAGRPLLCRKLVNRSDSVGSSETRRPGPRARSVGDKPARRWCVVLQIIPGGNDLPYPTLALAQAAMGCAETREMTEATTQTRRMMLEAGSLVILHPDGPGGGLPMILNVDHVDNGVHWFRGSIEPGRRDHPLIVEAPIANDARYATQARVTAYTPSSFGLQIDREWERVQQRAFVRVSAHGFRVRIVRVAASPSDESEPDLVDDVFDLIDISAGGIRFRCNGEFEVDEDVVCHVELPGSLCFVLPGRIVRSLEPEIQPQRNSKRVDKPSTAVEFVGLDEANRSQLLRWVYREQVRRHRAAARKAQHDT